MDNLTATRREYMATSKMILNPSTQGIVPKVTLSQMHGYSENPIDIDMINERDGYIYYIAEKEGFSGTSPISIIGGEGYLLIGASGVNDNTLRFGVQLAFGYGSSKLAIRNAPYRQSGSTWSAWREL